MSLYRQTYHFTLIAVVGGMLLGTCSLTTEPTESSSDFTSSTSPNSSSQPKPEQKAKSFTSDNFARVKEDMALGRGEHLASLATLLGIPEKHQAEFFALTKEKFSSLVSSEQITADEMFAALNQELLARPHLRGSAGQN
jgi:DUF3015 family protein